MLRFSVSAISAIALVISPLAWANQGNHHTGTVDDGSRASLIGSASVPSTGGVIATVRIQENLTSSSGLFQFGEISQGANFASDCGTGFVGFMIEHRPSGGSYTCDIYFGGFGTQHKFSVLRASDGSGFSAYLDGNYFAGPWALGFPSNGVAFASAEYNGTAPSSYDFIWGPTGSTTPWQQTTNYGSTWSTVTSASTTNDLNFWTIQGVPSPFHISH